MQKRLKSVHPLLHFSTAILTDPILYRLHEVIDTYGPAIKDIIHEQGGNAIMSAIDFGLDVDVTEDAEGNHRVIIKFDGKLLPYAKKGKYPW